jgi:hypothetical protein
VEVEALDALLSERDWWPNLPQDHEAIEEKRQDILSHVREGDKDIASGTHLYTIYDAETRSWGIVSNPTKGVLTFRIKNPVSDKLKTAAEKLVFDIQEMYKRRRSTDDMTLSFYPTIEVLEPDSPSRAFSGEILSANKLRHAIDQRKIEATVGLIAALAAVFFSVLTLPSSRSPIYLRLTPEWYEWLVGFLERLATSALVVATISWLHLLLHWLSLRRKGLILWSLD